MPPAGLTTQSRRPTDRYTPGERSLDVCPDLIPADRENGCCGRNPQTADRESCLTGRSHAPCPRPLRPQPKRTKYKTCTAQDASFREYGFDAMMVTFH